MHALRWVSSVLAAGFPLVAFLQLTRVYGQSLAQIADELRRVERLRPQLNEVRTLLTDLETRARQLRTEWLLSQATSARPQSSGRRP